MIYLTPLIMTCAFVNAVSIEMAKMGECWLASIGYPLNPHYTKDGARTDGTK